MDNINISNQNHTSTCINNQQILKAVPRNENPIKTSDTFPGIINKHISRILHLNILNAKYR